MDIRVLDILNSDHELQALPVEEDIQILLSEEPDTFDIESKIFLIRVESDQQLPNLSDAFIRSVGDTYVDNYDTLSYEYTIKPSVSPDGVELVLNPDLPLIPNSNFYLVVSKDLAPMYYSIDKNVSVGSSKLQLETGSNYIGEVATYRIVVSQTSNLAGGEHSIGVDLYKDAVPILTNHVFNIKEDKLDIGPEADTLLVSFSAGIPFISGEEWTIVTSEFTRVGTTQVQEISTFLDSVLIEAPEQTSKRLENEDLVKFYEDYGWSGRTTDDAVVTEVAESNAEYTFVYPNKLFIKLDKAILPASILDTSFNVDISYAFGNYLLPNMGLYNEEDKFVLKYSSHDSFTILLEINKDVDNIVPIGDKFILVSA
jgi:hypothetical protein